MLIVLHLMQVWSLRINTKACKTLNVKYWDYVERDYFKTENSFTIINSYKVEIAR